MTAYTINMNRDPKSNSAPAKAQDFFLFEPLEPELRISKEAVNCFFSLAEDRYLPPWALDKMKNDIRSLEKLRDRDIAIPDIRAFQGEGILILAPSVMNGWIESSFVIWEEPEEIIEIFNVDDRPKKARRSFIPKNRFPIRSDMQPDFEGYSTGVSLKIL